MDNRPIKGNKSGKYTVVIDPTNDIAAYYNGLDDLKDLIVYFRNKIVKILLNYLISKANHSIRIIKTGRI